MTKIKVWHAGMSDAESKDLAYWERNMLALRYADGWYEDDVLIDEFGSIHEYDPRNTTLGRITARFDGWRRVLSLEGGKITFHIRDDFEVGNLPQIERNWDGHTTEEKWSRILEFRGIGE